MSAPRWRDKIRLMPEELPTPSPERIPTEKERLELEKLRLEIGELKHWYKRPAYVQSLSSIVIAAIAASGGLFLAYWNGWFDSQRARLDAQKAAVQVDIDRLREGRNNLNLQVFALRAERDNLKSENLERGKQLEAAIRSLSQEGKRANLSEAERTRCLAEIVTLTKRYRAIADGTSSTDGSQANNNAEAAVEEHTRKAVRLTSEREGDQPVYRLYFEHDSAKGVDPVDMANKVRDAMKHAGQVSPPETRAPEGFTIMITPWGPTEGKNSKLVVGLGTVMGVLRKEGFYAYDKFK